MGRDEKRIRILPIFLPYRGCGNRCIFCNEDLAAGGEGTTPSSVPAILRERLALPHGGPLEVAFYGGNFTGLDPKEQEEVLQAVRPYLEGGLVSSLRVSTRPDHVDPAAARRLARLGVKTVELGAQSLDDEVLVATRRGHTAADVERAVLCLREEGIDVGLHLMMGLPGDDGGAFRRTVEAAVALRPETVRIHPTLVLRDTPLAEAYREGRYRPLGLDEAVVAAKEALLRFRRAGIRVTRLGLHLTDRMREPGAVVAGPAHPAFGALVRAALWLQEAESLLAGKDVASREVVFTVPPPDVSDFRGQRNENLRALQRSFGLSAVRVVPGDGFACKIH
ncbi:MAG TPA: radical SAM protein [Syntrophales bacterium]|nr:radical SAM protein [Syntrophales bacterium]HOM06488.1 radical SAM protein [Syntrophales bacterium]HON99873.1 radical SAM protein [Syntrophales bacterium]HPQ06250.1 radical SAM protein [Syntrophales bacterium]HRS86290.1 radical SAM protein [Syntrophales bacterium]